jgi:AmmeMemoRadiSam system protein A
MAPIAFTDLKVDLTVALTADEQQTLIATARESIRYGLVERIQFTVNPQDHSSTLQEHCASFVTLHIGEELRGCVGSIIASEPLITNVARNAYSAATKDRRFSSLKVRDLPLLSIEVSILSPLEEIQATTEEEILQQIIPHQHGVYISDGIHSSTFLPVVWDKLPVKQHFWTALKNKAGLTDNSWPTNMRALRYTAQKIG